MNISDLDVKFVTKYNKLFYEVAKYYSIEDKIFFWNGVLSTIDITKIGYKHASLIYIHTSCVIDFIKQNYPHLVPFYNFFYDIRNKKVDSIDCKADLIQINEAVTTIRHFLKKEQEITSENERQY